MSKWEWKKLKDICEKGSSNIKQSDLKDLTGDYPIFGASGYIQNVDFYQRDRDYIGIIKDGSGVGRTMLLPAFSSVIGTLQYILPKEGNDIKFINYALQNIDFSKSVQGAAIPHIYFKDYGETEILVPPLSEQNCIVKFLDGEFSKIDTFKTNAETNLKNAKELFYAELKKTFHEKGSWKTVQLGEIALEYGRGKSKHRPRNDECLFGGEYPFIQTGDIRNSGKYVVDYTETYNEIGLAQSKLWQKGTLCITIAANIAETAILTFPCCFPDSVIGFVPNEQYSSVDFIYYVILYFRTELQKISKGAAQDNLNLAKLESMNFPLPPLSVQKEIVARLDKLSENVKRLEANYKQIIADCDELKKSILKKTFEGDSRSSRE